MVNKNSLLLTLLVCALPALVSAQCASSPCRNGGECNVVGDQYYCVCKVGYTGYYCESQLAECTSSPCRNGGVCNDAGVNRFTCSCPVGFTGVICQTDINECYSSPCSNGGICSQSSGPGGFTCACPTGFQGSQCQYVVVNPTPCTSNPCRNLGTCYASGNAYTCSCRSGYTGAICESALPVEQPSEPTSTESAACLSSPCLHGGVCLQNMITNTFLCSCTAAFTGVQCETAVEATLDSCASNPCLNGATCINSVSDGSYSCACSSGFSGSTCEVNVFAATSSNSQSDGNNFGVILGVSIGGGIVVLLLVVMIFVMVHRSRHERERSGSYAPNAPANNCNEKPVVYNYGPQATLQRSTSQENHVGKFVYDASDV